MSSSWSYPTPCPNCGEKSGTKLKCPKCGLVGCPSGGCLGYNACPDCGKHGDREKL